MNWVTMIAESKEWRNWFTIDGSALSPYAPGDIHTEYEPQPVPLPAEVMTIKERLDENAGSVRVWNGLRYCLKRFQISRTPDAENPVLSLTFGPSDYDTFRATSLSLDAPNPVTGRTLRSLFLAEPEPFDQPKPFLANSFGVTLLPITSDGRLVLAKRASNALLRPSCYGAGLSEGLRRPTDRAVEGDGPDPYKAAIRGCIEEFGCGALEREIVFFAFGLDTELYQYGLLGYVRLPLSAMQLREVAELWAKDRFERQELVFVPATWSDLETFINNHRPWSPSGLVCTVMGLFAIEQAGLIAAKAG